MALEPKRDHVGAFGSVYRIGPFGQNTSPFGAYCAELGPFGSVSTPIRVRFGTLPFTLGPLGCTILVRFGPYKQLHKSSELGAVYEGRAVKFNLISPPDPL